MLMMQPPASCACMTSLAHCATKSGAIRLSVMIDAWSRGEVPWTNAGGPPPALFTTTSRRPSRAVVASTRPATASASRTSAAMNTASRPSTDGMTSGWCRPQMTTAAPRARNASVIPRPTPPAPPVTSTARPVMSSTSSTTEVVACAAPARRRSEGEGARAGDGRTGEVLPPAALPALPSRGRVERSGPLVRVLPRPR